jgi:hypothetical protein
MLHTEIKSNPVDTIFQLASGLWVSRALWAAARLRLADLVGEQPVALGELAAAARARPDMLGRLMNALTSFGIFARTADDRFEHSDVSRHLRSDHPASQRAIIESVFGHEHYEAWGAIEHSLCNGETAFEVIYDMPVFAWFGEQPASAKLFSEAMTSSTRMIEKELLAVCDFGSFSLAVDVGGSQGSLLRGLLARHSHARGILFDLPEIVDLVRPALKGSRIKGVSGNFFEAVPAGGDLYLLKFILHDWTDEQCGVILRNIRAAIAPGGRIAIAEIVLPEGGQPSPDYLMDLNMMVMTGGRERTASEFDALLRDAGFRMENVTATGAMLSLIEAVAV